MCSNWAFTIAKHRKQVTLCVCQHMEGGKQSKGEKRQHNVGSEKKEETSQQKVLGVVILQ